MNPGTHPPPDNLLLKVAVSFVILAAGGAILLYANRDWSAPATAKNLQNPVPATDESIARGMKIYSLRCRHCHGESGDGKGERVGNLSVAPSDFTDEHAMGLISDGELFWKISHGRRPMPSFQGQLSEQERWQLVDFIRTFAQRPPAGVTPAAN